MPTVRRLTAILAADVAGYSRRMGTDEEGTHERLRAHLRELVRWAAPVATADRDSAAAFPAPPLIRSRQRARDRKFADSPLEGTGFEPSVPRDRAEGPPRWAQTHLELFASKVIPAFR
jgi:hypothetical protein